MHRPPCPLSLLGMLLALIFPACTGDQSKTEKAVSGPPTQAAVPVDSSPLRSLVPGADAVPGWSQTEAPRIFGAGNLWEYIDGAADSYLAYGFQEMVTADFTHAANGDQAILDIFRMSDPLHAFGIFHQELTTEPEPLEIGAEGYVAGNVLRFWAGPYYVKVTIFTDNAALAQSVQQLARAVSQRTGDRAGIPVQVGYFPAANQAPHSIKYVPRDVLGQSYLTNGFEVEYTIGSTNPKLVIIELKDGQAVDTALSRYQEFIASGGDPVKALESPGEGGFVGRDSFYGPMVAVRSQHRLLVALGVSSGAAGQSLISQALKLIASSPQER